MENPARILVVDDEEIVRINLERVLSKQGYEVAAIDNGSKALKLIKEKEYNMVLADLVLEGMNGLELLEHIKKMCPETIVIILTGYGSMKSAIEALRKGAFDYMLKTYDEDDELLFRVKRGLERQAFGRQLRQQEFEKERLKAITELAVTCNDQINSPLGVILGHIEMLRINLPIKDETIKQSFEIIELEIKKIEDIMSSLTRMAQPVIRDYGMGKYTMIDLKRSIVKKPGEVKEEKAEKKILLVDDDNLMVDLMANMVKAIGYTPLMAFDGNEGMEILKDEDVDLVITDINMPGMSGIELMERIKAEDENLPVVLITGFGKPEAAQIAHRRKADGFLGKPFNLSDFRSLIEMLI